MVGSPRPGSAASPNDDTRGKRGSVCLNESMFKLSELMKLHSVFEADSALTEKQFVAHFGSILGSDNWSATQISQLFMKIDANSDGTVDWDEFTNFMFLNANATKDASATATAAFLPREEYVAVETPMTTHRARDVFVAIETLPRSGHYLTCTHGGVVSTYAPTGLSSPLSTFKTTSTRSKTDWVSSICYLPHLAKLAVASMEAGVVLYDLSTPDKKAVAKLPGAELEHATPLCLCSMIDDSSGRESLFIGDDVGCLTQVTFDGDWHLCDGELGCHATPTLTGCQVVRTERHSDHVSCVAYVADLNCVVSASHDGSVKVVDLTRGTLKRDFRQHKGAVHAFAWCKEAKLIASCGLERQILLWSPYSIRLVGRLAGHTGSIKLVLWSSPCASLLSLGFDGLVRVWDIKNGKCCQVIEDAAHEQHKVAAVAYDDKHKHLLTASSALNAWPLHPLAGLAEATHEHPICKVLYNPSFQQVVSLDASAHVVLWNLLDGSMISHFDISDTTITAAALDESGRRLITGSHAGDDVKLWNFSNGSLLTTLKKQKDDRDLDTLLQQHRVELDAHAGRVKLPTGLPLPVAPAHRRAPTANEVTSVLSITASIPYSSGRGFSQTKYVACTGWDRCVYLWNDGSAPEYLRRMPAKQGTAGHTDDVLALAYCPPKVLATGGVDGCVILWGLNSGDLMHKFQFESGIEALLYPPKLGLLVGVTTNATLLLINPRHAVVHATAELKAPDAAHEVRVARCDVDGDLLFTGLSTGVVQVFRVGRDVHRLHEWPAHASAIASLDYVEMASVLETFLLTTATESLPTIKLWTLGGALVGLFGHDLWDLTDARWAACAVPAEPATAACAVVMGPPKAAEIYHKEHRGLQLGAPPAVGDVWFRKDELGLIGAVVTLTSVSRSRGHVEGVDNAQVRTELALVALFDHAWHRHEFLSGLVGRVFHDATDAPPFKVASAAHTPSGWRLIDTVGCVHVPPSEKDSDPAALRAPRSLALFRMFTPEPAAVIFPGTRPPAPTVPHIVAVPTPRLSNPFVTTARVQAVVTQLKRPRATPRAPPTARPPPLSEQCAAVQERLPRVPPVRPASPTRKETYTRLDARAVVPLDEGVLGDFAALRSALATKCVLPKVDRT
ncbi:hypothetical protein ACHHYP_13261 [Achlya hypogyna]|uniref:EF-hand domain-containing protein n=1 Tax=Achlya hypogyna TaxID=1202772 RepID=A0A1V9YFR6_ACHHY|nr:hypothetical protein ACHHYP_13261 [Achlya hypogyna]